MPEYAHHYTLVDDISTVAEGSAMAMGMVTAVELAPALLNVMGKLANNQVSLVEAGNALIANLKEKSLLKCKSLRRVKKSLLQFNFCYRFKCRTLPRFYYFCLGHPISVSTPSSRSNLTF